MEQPLLTVIVPVYNEEKTIRTVLQRLDRAPYPEKQIIVVDDGSTDGTSEQLRGWAAHSQRIALRHERNRGKGAAVRTGLEHARGVFTVIQDADLEYDPDELPRLVDLLQAGSSAVVYGSRYLRPTRPRPWTRYRLAVSLLNGRVWVVYGQRLTDEATCYKAVTTALLRSLDLEAERFELCAEMTAKLCRLGLPIREVPISYHPRSRSEGKKIGWRDAFATVLALLKWRWLPFPAQRIRVAIRTG